MTKRRIRIALQFLLALACLAGADSVYACSCVAGSTAQEAFEQAGTVTVARVVGFEMAPASNSPEREFRFPFGIKSVKLTAESVFKGKLKVGARLDFPQGEPGGCSWSFSPDQAGEQFLFYLPGSGEKAVGTPTACGRSARIQRAAEDLLYLNNIRARRGQTRISGTLEAPGDFDGSLAGFTVHIKGANAGIDVVTNKDGVYEAYDLPPGDYRISLEPRSGWMMIPWIGDAPDTPADAPRGFPVNLPAKKHAGIEIRLGPDSAIRGSVRDAAGAPLRNVRLNLIPIELTRRPPAYLSVHRYAISDAAGVFRFESIVDGVYSLEINEDDSLTGFQPFRRFYYPDASALNQGSTFVIKAGVHYEDVVIQPPDMAPTVTIEGRLLYSDGKPAAGATVNFEAAKPEGRIAGASNTRTDEQGAFSITLLKDVAGTLFGSMTSYRGEFEKCPALDALIEREASRLAGSFQGRATVKTPERAINATTDSAGIELRFPFPACKRAKPPK